MHVLQDLYAETSRPLGLTPQQAHLLCVLLGGPLGMTELSRILSIERSSLTSMVDRLERRDLVARTANPTDRRACQIELTTAGQALAHDAHNAVITRIEALTADLPRPPAVPSPPPCRRSSPEPDAVPVRRPERRPDRLPGEWFRPGAAY